MTVTYAKFFCNIRTQKQEIHRTCLTVGVDRIDYMFDAITRTVDINTTKIFLNSKVSTPNAKAMSLDLKYGYLNTPQDWYEYMKIEKNNTR